MQRIAARIVTCGSFTLAYVLTTVFSSMAVSPTNADAYRAIQLHIMEYSHTLFTVSNGGPWNAGERRHLSQRVPRSAQLSYPPLG